MGGMALQATSRQAILTLVGGGEGLEFPLRTRTSLLSIGEFLIGRRLRPLAGARNAARLGLLFWRLTGDLREATSHPQYEQLRKFRVADRLGIRSGPPLAQTRNGLLEPPPGAP